MGTWTPVPLAPPAGRSSYPARSDLRPQSRSDRSLSARVTRGAHARLAVLGGIAATIALVVGILIAHSAAPWWLGPVTAAGLFAMIVTILPGFMLRRPDHQLALVLGVSVGDTARRWAKAFPFDALPTSRDSTADWLATSRPDELDPDTLGLEASGLTLFGRYEDARARIARMRTDAPMHAFVREYLAAHIDFSSGGSGSLDEARRLASRMAGEDRRVAVAELALEEAGRAIVLGHDWGPPIAEAYAELGGIPLRLLLVAGLNRAVLFGTRLALGMFAVAVAVAFVASVT